MLYEVRFKSTYLYTVPAVLHLTKNIPLLMNQWSTPMGISVVTGFGKQLRPRFSTKNYELSSTLTTLQLSTFRATFKSSVKNTATTKKKTKKGHRLKIFACGAQKIFRLRRNFVR